MTLASTAADVASINDANLVPDAGSVNPWTNGTPVFVKNRSYHMLFIPQPRGQFNVSTLAPGGQAGAVFCVPCARQGSAEDLRASCSRVSRITDRSHGIESSYPRSQERGPLD